MRASSASLKSHVKISNASLSRWFLRSLNSSSEGGLPREHRLNDDTPDAPDSLGTGDPLWPDHRSTLARLSNPADSNDEVRDIPAGDGTARELAATSDSSRLCFMHVDCEVLAAGGMTTATGPISVDQGTPG